MASEGPTLVSLAGGFADDFPHALALAGENISSSKQLAGAQPIAGQSLASNSLGFHSRLIPQAGPITGLVGKNQLATRLRKNIGTWIQCH
jgi:hypothetical protein